MQCGIPTGTSLAQVQILPLFGSLTSAMVEVIEHQLSTSLRRVGIQFLVTPDVYIHIPAVQLLWAYQLHSIKCDDNKIQG